MSEAAPLVSVIIPNWNGHHLLARCLESLEAQTYGNFETIVVDNGSVDESCTLVAERFPQVRLIRLCSNTGFANACNVGIEASNAKYVALLNNDTEARKPWLGSLVATMESSSGDVACITSKMLQLDDSTLIDDAGDYLTWHGGAFKRGHGRASAEFGDTEEVMLPCAGAALYRRDVLEEMDGFDSRFFAYLEDVDLGLRIRLGGYRCIYDPGAEVLHQGRGSRIQTELYIFLTTRNRGYVFAKNIPAMLLLKRLPYLVYGWVFFLVVHRGAWMYWRGTFALVKNIGYLLKKRREQARRTSLTSEEIDDLLRTEWPEIGVGTLLKREYRRLRAG